MQTSQNHKTPYKFQNQTAQEQQLCSRPPISYSCDDASHPVPLPAQNVKHYCTLESSSAIGNKFVRNYPDSGSCVTDNEHDLMQMLRQLETAVLGPDSDDQITSKVEKWQSMVEMIWQGDIKELLCACAKSIENNDIFAAECLMTALRKMVSVSGEPIQRMGAYMLEIRTEFGHEDPADFDKFLE